MAFPFSGSSRAGSSADFPPTMVVWTIAQSSKKLSTVYRFIGKMHENGVLLLLKNFFDTDKFLDAEMAWHPAFAASAHKRWVQGNSYDKSR
jgi:hypothetical protein